MYLRIFHTQPQPKRDKLGRAHWVFMEPGYLIFCHIRNENSVDFELFKNNLDIFLACIPDQPTTSGLGRAALSNSLLDQVPLIADLY